MREHNLQEMLRAIESVEGWFLPDAAVLFVAYNQLLRERGLASNVLEIGVYHGKSAVLLAGFRADAAKMVAVDLFEALQAFGAEGGAVPMEQAFRDHLRAAHGSLDFLYTIAGSSADLTPADLGTQFSFCHIDGDHSQEGTYHDIGLAYSTLVPGGLLAMDDYFNPLFPGVAEGAFRWSLERPGALRPVAVGYNKALFQKPLPDFDINAAFAERFPYLPHGVTQIWKHPAYLFAFGAAEFVDAEASTTARLVPQGGFSYQAVIEPHAKSLPVGRGRIATLPVRVANRSSFPFNWGISLAYHLYSSDGTLLSWENGRNVFPKGLPPGQECIVSVGIRAPDAPGRYRIELDLVWDGVTWFKDKGNPTVSVELAVA